CFFSLLRPHPPPSTLFPYTTLFRSLKVIPGEQIERLSWCFPRRVPARLMSAQGSTLTEPCFIVCAKLDIVRLSSVTNCTVVYRRSEEHTSELQSRFDLVCRLLLEKK